MPLSDETKSKVKRQVEFYFSDSNLPRDNFLRSKVEEHPQGFVDLALICSFMRMLEALGITRKGKDPVKVNPETVKEVAEVLRGADSLEVSEDGKQVRRAQPLPDAAEVSQAVDARSLYAAPFPFDATLDALTAFFAGVAPVNCVRMRRHLSSKDFRGSVFVEFATEEAAKEVLGKTLEYEGAPLQLEPKLDYVKRKETERKNKPLAKPQADDFFAGPATPTPNGATAAAGKVNGTAAPKAEQAAEKEAAADAAEPAAAGAGAAEDTPAEADEEEPVRFEPGLLLRFDFGDATHELSYEDIKAAFGRNMAFVEFQKGASSGIMRYKKKEGADEALGKVDGDGQVMVSGVSAKLTRVEGDDEVDFYKRASAARRTEGGDGRGQKRHRDFEGGGRRGGGRGRGRRGFRGRGGKRGRY